jgi:hypothetical protein
VKDLSFSFFRERLVEHFQIEFNKPLGGITWPKRNRLPEPVPLPRALIPSLLQLMGLFVATIVVDCRWETGDWFI